MQLFLFKILAQVSEGDLDIPKGPADPNAATNALQIVFGIAGAIALLFITLGGFKYIISQGNPQETAKAKDTILYALIGLVVVLFAFSILTFVIGRV